MRIDVFGKALEFGGGPTTFKLGAVLAFLVELEIVVIHKVGKLGMTHCPFGHDGGDKDNPVGLGQDQVPRQDDGASDADGRVDCGQRHLLPEGGIVTFVETVKVGDLAVLFLISYPAVEDKTSVGVGGYA